MSTHEASRQSSNSSGNSNRSSISNGSNFSVANSDGSRNTAFEYAFYIPEGTGYLYVSPLGAGAFGEVDLVWSCENAARAFHSFQYPDAAHHTPELWANSKERSSLTPSPKERPKADTSVVPETSQQASSKETSEASPKEISEARPQPSQGSASCDAIPDLENVHFARKKLIPARIDNEYMDLRYWPNPPREVRHHRLLPSIPALIDWTEYRPLPRGHKHHLVYSTHSMIFQYCNGGTLYSALAQARRVMTMIPESFLWKVFGQLLLVVDRLHHSNPAILHNDIHLGNVFLHFSTADTQTLPDCFLGDFGISETFDVSRVPVNDSDEGDYFDDYEQVRQMIAELMTQKEARHADGRIREIEHDLDTMRHNRTFYSNTLFDAMDNFQKQVLQAKLCGTKPEFSSLAQQFIDHGQAANTSGRHFLRNVQRNYPPNPEAFPSRAKLLAKERLPNGPWKIAKIRKDTKAVISLSQRVYRTYEPSRRGHDEYVDVRRTSDEHSMRRSSRDMPEERM